MRIREHIGQEEIRSFNRMSFQKCIKVIARLLILWDEIVPELDWTYAQVPEIIKKLEFY